VPRLIVLNGPPGIGKSTLAERYVDHHPLSLCLEQDVVRGLLGGWLSRESESGTLARKLCLAMAREHLLAQHDVIVPQFVALPSYLDQLAAVARDVGADHVELVLLDDARSAESRFHARLRDPSRTEHHRVAATFVAEAGGYAHQYERLVRGLVGRNVTEILSLDGDIDGTYRRLLGCLR
jgi:predicted kinase